MGGRVFRPDRQVFPIRQDMDRDEVDRVVDFPVTQPVLPDVGIGHRNGDLRLDRADGGCKIGRRHLAAQQHLVADHKRGDHAGIFLGESHRRGYLGEIFQPVAAEPDTLDDLEADFGGKFRNPIKAVLDRIRPDAIGYFGELLQVLGNLLGRDMRRRHQRRLGVAERRIGNAQQFGRGIDRRPRQRHRCGQPPPHRGNRAQGYEEKRQRRTKGNRFRPPGSPSISRSPAVCQGQRSCNHSLLGEPALPQRDKVAVLLDKIQIVRHGNPVCLRRNGDPFERHQRPCKNVPAGNNSGILCVSGCSGSKMRACVVSPHPVSHC